MHNIWAFSLRKLTVCIDFWARSLRKISVCIACELSSIWALSMRKIIVGIAFGPVFSQPSCLPNLFFFVALFLAKTQASRFRMFHVFTSDLRIVEHPTLKSLFFATPINRHQIGPNSTFTQNPRAKTRKDGPPLSPRHAAGGRPEGPAANTTRTLGRGPFRKKNKHEQLNASRIRKLVQ